MASAPTATSGSRGLGTKAPEPATAAPHGESRRRLSLLWWVLLANASVLVVAVVLLAVTPITVSAPIALAELALLVLGLVAMVALHVVLLRRVLAPFFRFTEVMRSIDPDRPGLRVAGVDPRTAEGAALVDAFNAMLDRLESARREAARTALAAQEAERARVARELHDEIGQTLTAVMLGAERASDGDPASAGRELARVADAVRDSLDEVRRIARELRPEALDDLGLVNALIALCSRVGTQQRPRVERRLQGGLPPLAPDVELVIYRIAQEALTNALRHADAELVAVSLAADAEAVTLTVEDDGKGIPSELPRDTSGISGMRERALLVDGRLSIESAPGRGTRVVFSVPLDDDRP